MTNGANGAATVREWGKVPVGRSLTVAARIDITVTRKQVKT